MSNKLEVHVQKGIRLSWPYNPVSRHCLASRLRLYKLQTWFWLLSVHAQVWTWFPFVKEPLVRSRHCPTHQEKEIIRRIARLDEETTDLGSRVRSCCQPCSTTVGLEGCRSIAKSSFQHRFLGLFRTKFVSP